MVVDSSVIVAVLKQELGFEAYLPILMSATTVLLPSPTYVESSIVLKNKLGTPGLIALKNFIKDFGIDITPFTETQARIAQNAFLKYGKGQGHPAQLNYGDCMAYAAARDAGLGLLFKGDDFRKTDVVGVS